MNKTMEKEYKWRADEKLLGQALLWASSRIGSQSRTINMESSYFDTADGLLKEHQAALRLRRENDRSVCCMKLRNTDTPDGMRAHEEYQCEAVSLLGRSAPFARAWCAERPVRLGAGSRPQETAPFHSAGVRSAAGWAIPCAKWRLTKANAS